MNAAPLVSKINNFSCVADPLADLCLVSLWQDVDVGLEGAGFNHSFVSVGQKQKQNPAEDGEQLLMLASRKLQADYFKQGQLATLNITCIKAPQHQHQRVIHMKHGSPKVCLYSTMFRLA